MILVQGLLLLLSYASGAIPFGYLLTMRSTGLNIMEHGSGNTGSTNVGRIAGKRIAFWVQVLDMLKGLLPVALVLGLKSVEWLAFPSYFVYLIAFSTIVGHNFSIFLRFRGGKGVNTTLGATLLLAPVEVFIAVALYFILKSFFKFVSVGSMALACALPLSGILLHHSLALIAYLSTCCLMILFRHKANIGRLIAGKELK